MFSFCLCLAVSGISPFCFVGSFGLMLIWLSFCLIMKLMALWRFFLKRYIDANLLCVSLCFWVNYRVLLLSKGLKKFSKKAVISLF